MRPIPIKALAKLLGLSHESNQLVHGAAIDSRKIHLGDLFFALPGNRVDGHQFLKEAKEKGASLAVIQKNYQGETFNLPVLRVTNVLDTLHELARKKLQNRTAKVVGITGSLGKTTTKVFAKTFLETKYRVFASPLSYNSQVTLPLSILLSDETEEVLLLEMGMTHKGQIEKLISIAPPDIAVITNVAVQHANNFSDGLEGIGREKASIFGHTKTSRGILHKEMLNFEEAYSQGTFPKQCFSLNDRSADYSLEIHGDRVKVYFEGRPSVDLAVSFPLKPYYQNLLASIAIARALDVPWDFIQESVRLLKLPAMRFEKIEKQGILFINDAFNANPDSIAAALESLPEPKSGGKKLAVLSEMDALGSYSEKSHRDVAEKALQCADILFCVGSRCTAMKEIWDSHKRPAYVFDSKEKLLEDLKKVIKSGDVVLLKGARSYALDTLLDKF